MRLAGENNVELLGVPPSLAGVDIDTILYDLLRIVEVKGSLEEHLRESMVKALAIRGSRVEVFDNDLAKELLQRLCECENFSFSPSGRAIMIEIPIAELKAYLG